MPDPKTPDKAESRSSDKTEAEATQQVVEEVVDTSSDAQFSTYEQTPAPAPHRGTVAPPGKQVEQTRGTPSEEGGEVFTANR